VSAEPTGAALLNRVAELEASGDVETAAELLDRGLRNWPPELDGSRADAMRTLGRLLHRLGWTAEAETQFKESIGASRRALALDAEASAFLSGGESRDPFRAVIGRSDALLSTLARVRTAAESTEPILILGEPGTGKRMIAHGIHRVSRTISGTATGPVAALDCAALPADALEFELFGGASDTANDGTGLLAAVHAGTLVLQAFDHLPDRLAQRLQGDGAAAVRIVAIAKAPMSEDARARLETLLTRTGGAATGPTTVEVPPLRHRDGDIDLLTDHFLAQMAHEHGGGTPEVTTAARFALSTHRWPGNVRELRSALAGAFHHGGAIAPDTLRIRLRSPALQAVEQTGTSAPRSLAEIEDDAVRRTLVQTGGNRTRAAQVLGISRPTLLRKIKRASAVRTGS